MGVRAALVLSGRAGYLRGIQKQIDIGLYFDNILRLGYGFGIEVI